MTTAPDAAGLSVPPATVTGTGGLPCIALAAADGAAAGIHLHGAHVTSWRPAGEAADRLFTSARSHFSAGMPIRGGIPVCFPQFATEGPLPQHGFARVLQWTPIAAGPIAGGRARAVLRLADSDATRALWPHAFRLELTVTVGGATLEALLAITNTGAAPFAFTAARHTYLRVIDIREATVHGLQGAHYRDKARGFDDGIETAPALAFGGEVDRVYRCAPDDLEVREAARSMAVRATGFPDSVVWNPGATRSAAIGDMEPGGFLRMLCVEAAVVRAPVVLAPGAAWTGTQTLTAR